MRAAICGALLASVLTTTALAQEPVEFDARRLFSCAAVKPPQQADAARKVILVVIPISANFNVAESTVESLRYELRFPKAVTVVDHLPKTQTGTNIVGAQREQRQEHKLTDLNVKFGGEGRVAFSVYGVGVNLGGGAERTKRDFNEVKTNVQVDRLPARDQIVVAGTRDEGQTLYFDLRWHDQTTRAGQTDYAILAEVPKDWTGDVATLACIATQNRAVAGRLTKVIGLYLSGDSTARRRIEKQLETARPTASGDDEGLITNSIDMKMRLMPTGTFLMGATPNEPDADDDARPQHKVAITRPYYLGVYEVTQYEYRQVTGKNPSNFKGSDRLPVEQVSWLDAVTFCNKLSQKEKRKPFYMIEGIAVTVLGGNGYRLPTEAEWEYACRAPQSSRVATKNPFGDGDFELSNYAWFAEKSRQKNHLIGQTHPVGQKDPNRWGLYDMQGNVYEWCQDFYSQDYYRFTQETDPPGPASGTEPFRNFGPAHPFRGGCWCHDREGCSPSFRNFNHTLHRSNFIGFRVAASRD